MCWSATADLVAGGAITAVGVVCVARAARVRPRAVPLAALPLLLGAHQLIEAAVWHAGGGTGAATLAWAVIALPLLPLWVPLAVWWAVSGAARRRLWLPVAVGAVTSVVLAGVLATHTVTAEIRGHTMAYAIGLPHAAWLIGGYLVATIGALLLSGERALVLLGALVGAGAAVCAALWRWEFVSTWCACAALCSVLLLGWVRRGVPAAPRSTNSPPVPRS
ncbi:DUF6629 family protein [Streptomyces xanthii]|uniref:Integral membrane protein n=1 Tax=Streptomyces xanthii TaxID=2768069 RepID=A0A7H1BGR3_9ACTN|nr:DUF6629 family protein [Streptomyces xanthii]QNS07918.1 hypothetical protein IAG42_32785 [Streptomyces xanthii]